MSDDLDPVKAYGLADGDVVTEVAQFDPGSEKPWRAIARHAYTGISCAAAGTDADDARTAATHGLAKMLLAFPHGEDFTCGEVERINETITDEINAASIALARIGFSAQSPGEDLADRIARLVATLDDAASYRSGYQLIDDVAAKEITGSTVTMIETFDEMIKSKTAELAWARGMRDRLRAIGIAREGGAP